MVQRLALILVGVLLAGLGLEAALRIADPIPEVGAPLSAFFAGDPYLGWRGRPNLRLRFHRPEFDTLVVQDAAGWRQGEPAPPADAARRVLVLGDSFTWGWGVDQGELFTDRLQARLAPGIAVDNRGAVAFGTAQEYLLLQDELTAAHDTVLVMFYINDLANNLGGSDGARPFFELVDGDLQLRNSPARVPTNGFERFATEHSRAYAYLEFALGTVKRRFRGEAGDEREYREAPAVDSHAVPGYAVTARLLEEMNRFASAHGARLVLVYIPQRSEFEGAAPYPYVHAVHFMIDDIADRAGIPVIDLTPAFRAATRAGRRLIYPIDAHWTPAGHQVAAEVLLESAVLTLSRQKEFTAEAQRFQCSSAIGTNSRKPILNGFGSEFVGPSQASQSPRLCASAVTSFLLDRLPLLSRRCVDRHGHCCSSGAVCRSRKSVPSAEPERRDLAAGAGSVTRLDGLWTAWGIAVKRLGRRRAGHRACRSAAVLALVAVAALAAEAGAERGRGIEIAELAQVAEVSVSPARGGRIQLELAAPGGPRLAVRLAPSSPFASGARDVWMDDAGVTDEAPAQVFYRGRVAGEPRSWARIALRAGALAGVIWTPGEIYFLEPANRFNESAVPSATLLYRLSDVGSAWEAALCRAADASGTVPGADVRAVHGAALYDSLASALRAVAGAPGGDAVLVADSAYAGRYGAAAAGAMQDVFHVLGGLRRQIGRVAPIARTVVHGGGERGAALDGRPGRTIYVFDPAPNPPVVVTSDCPEPTGRAIETWLRAGGGSPSGSRRRATVPLPTPTPTPQFSDPAPLDAEAQTSAAAPAAASFNTMAQAAIGQAHLLTNALNETGPRSLYYPYDVARDPTVAQTRLYVVDGFNFRVLGFECAGANCALAMQTPASRVFGQPDFVHHDQNGGLLGKVSASTVNFPEAVAVGPSGTLFVADTGNNRVLVYQSPWTSDAVADIVLGQPSMSGSAPGSALNQMRAPSGLFVDGSGVLWVADTGNNRVLKFTTIATGASAAFAIGGAGGPSAMTLSGPRDVVLDAAGGLYVADTGFHRVLRYAPPLTGGMAATIVFGHAGSMTNGTANQGGIGAGSLSAPERLEVDGAGRLWIADTGNNRVLAFDTPLTNQNATRVFGQASRTQVPTFSTGGNDAPDGFVNAAGFWGPRGLTFDGSGTLWVADRDNSRVVGFDNALGGPPASIIADRALGKPDFVSNYANIPAQNRLNNPVGIAVDRARNRLWVSDIANNRVLGYGATANIRSNVAADRVLGQSSFTAGSTNAGLNNPLQNAANAVASASSLLWPVDVAVDSLGGVYVADGNNSRVLHYQDPFAGDAIADRVFGQDNFSHRNSDFPYGTASSLNGPNGVSVGAGNDLWIADTIDHRVVRFANAPAQPTTGSSANLILGQSGFVSSSTFPPHAPGCAANRMNLPTGVFAAASGRVYVADTGNHRVLVFAPPFTNGMNAAAVIGQANPTSCAANRGGAVGAATLRSPRGVYEDVDGTVFIADTGNNRVLVYDAPFGGGDLVADAVIGQPNFTSTAITSPLPNTLWSPNDVAMDGNRNLFVSDGENSRVTRYALDAPPTVLLDPISDPIVVGAFNGLTGSGFTAGSVIVVFVSVGSGVAQFGPYTPTNWSSGALIWMPPPTMPLGNGFATVAVVNTDQGYIGSEYQPALLYGNAGLNRPTILGVNGSGLHAPDGALPVVYVNTPVYPGSEVTLTGTGFNVPAVNFYTGVGNLGPLSPKPGATATQLKVDIPSGTPLGLGAFEVINSPYTGSVGSQTIYVPVGDRPTLTGVTQSGSTIIVRGTGLAAGAVVNFYNKQGSGVVNLGGPGLAVTVVGPTELRFTVPNGAVPGPCFVQVINPPYINFTATGNDPDGGFILVAP